jgi:membrane associated rhomboid family serine protease
MGVILLPTMFAYLAVAPNRFLIWFFAWIIIALLVPQLKLLFAPRQLVIDQEKLIAKGSSAFASPIQNIAQISHNGQALCLRFHSLDALECKPKVRNRMEKALSEHGYDVAFPGFTYAQGEMIRSRLGMQPEPPGATLSAIQKYQQQTRQLTPKVFVTYVLLGLNCMVFLLMLGMGVSLTSPDTPDLLDWGANFGPLTANEQGWRLLTCMFLHVGILHLAFNMWALVSVGVVLERLVGNVGFLILYVVAGIVGSITSVRVHPLVVAAGASGAIFGLYGGLIGYLLLHRESMPAALYRPLWKSGLAFLLFNLLFGWASPGIDVAAHLGGAIAGFLGGLVLSQPLDGRTKRSRKWRNLLLLAFSAFAIVPAFYWLPKSSSNEGAWVSTFFDYLRVQPRLFGKYDRAVEGNQRGTMSNEALAQLVETEILPQWLQWQKRFSEIGPLDGKREDQRKLWLQFMDLRKESWQLLVDALKKNDVEIAKQSRQKADAADAVVQRFNASWQK